MSDIDDYLSSISEEQKTVFESIRKTVKKITPEAEEVISYGVPTFKVNKKPLLYFGAFKNHMSLFPASDGMVKVIPELEKFRVAKGTLRFSEQQPIPEAMLKKIINYRLNSIAHN
jgi:uncharacterized protein YdhG (YjbR/CyaY superfamily)